MTLLYIKKFRYNRNVGVFLIFLLLSTFFWFLNELENEYVTNITYPIKYENPPQDKMFVGNMPSYLELEIKGTGFKLLEYKLGKEMMPIEFEVTSYNLRTKEKDNTYYLLTQSVRERMSQQLSSDLEIVNITPDTLHFQFAEQKNKKVPVVSNINYTFSKQLMLKSSIQIKPDSITISGPNTILDTVEVVSTIDKSLGEISETVERMVAVREIHPQVEYSVKKVNVTIPVEQYTEGAIRKEITIKNLPDSLIVRTFPRFVQIRFLVGLSNYQNVMPELFKVSVNFKDTREDSERLKVSVDNAPEYLKSYSYNPHKVDYIIEKRND